jgi:hypothetical protein
MGVWSETRVQRTIDMPGKRKDGTRTEERYKTFWSNLWNQRKRKKKKEQPEKKIRKMKAGSKSDQKPNAERCRTSGCCQTATSRELHHSIYRRARTRARWARLGPARANMAMLRRRAGRDSFPR